jgi:hypothetical protein
MLSKENVGKWISIIVMLVCSAWFVARWSDAGFPWDPLVPFIIALGAYAKLEVSQSARVSKVDDVSIENDADLFRQLHELLPSHGAIEFVKHHDFGGSFLLRDLDPIGRFCYEWDNPQHEFNDQQLEAQRADLLRAAKYFSHAIALKTAPRAAGIQSAVPGHIDSDGPFPEWVRQDIREIHLAAHALVDEHEKMMRLGRKRLRIATGAAPSSESLPRGG